MGVVFDKKTDDELRKHLIGNSDYSRNPGKVDNLKTKAKVLREYFSNQDVKVETLLNSGFTTLGFISIQGNDIKVDNETVIEVIRQGASYANVILEDGPRMQFEIGYADLASPKQHYVRSPRRAGTSEELEELICQSGADYDSVFNSTENSISFSDEISIKDDDKFWDILGIAKKFHIFRKGEKAFEMEFEV